MQEEFEKWAKSHHGFMRLGKVDGFYSNDKVQESWFTWQYSWNTSRGTLRVELPATNDDFIDKQVMQNTLVRLGVSYE